MIWNKFIVLAMRMDRCVGSGCGSGSGSGHVSGSVSGSNSGSCYAPSKGTLAGSGTEGGFVDLSQHVEKKQSTLNILQESPTRAIIAGRRRGASNHGRKTRRLFR